MLGLHCSVRTFLFAILLTLCCQAVTGGLSGAEEIELVLQSGHTSILVDLLFSPDGRFLVSSGEDGTKIWELATNRELLTIPFYGSSAFSNDSKRLYICSGERILKVFQMDTGDIRDALPRTCKAAQIAISRDGRYIAVGTIDNRVWLLEESSMRVLHKWPAGKYRPWCVALSPDGHLAAAGGFKRIKFWDTSTGNTLPDLTAHNNWVMRLAFSPDGKRLASLSDDGIKLWDTKLWQEIKKFPNDKNNRSTFQFDGDGRLLILSMNQLRLIDSFSGEMISTFQITGANKFFSCMALNPSNNLIAANENPSRLITIWNFPDGMDNPYYLAPLNYGITSLAVSPDGKKFVSGGWDYFYTVWDVVTGGTNMIPTEIKHPISTMTFSPSGQWLALGIDKTVKVINMERGGEEQKILAHEYGSQYAESRLHGDNAVQKIVFCADDTEFITAGVDGLIKLWDTVNGKNLRTFRAYDQGVLDFDLSPDGKQLASTGSQEETIKIWDLATAKLVRTLSGHSDTSGRLSKHAYAVAYDPKGRWLVSSGTDGRVKLWDPKKLNEGVSIGRNISWATGLAFSSKGEMLASWSGYTDANEKIKIYEVETKKQKFSFPEADTTQAVFFRNDQFLLSAHHRGVIKVWSTTRAKELVTLIPFQGTEKGWLAITPEGFFDGTRNAWQLFPFRFLSEPLKLYEPEQFFNQFYQPGLLTDIFHEGKSMPEILKDRKDPRANLDISAYRNSKMPEVTILSPENRLNTGEREVQVTIEAKSTGSGIRDLRVFRNQSLVHFEKGDLKPDPKSETCRLTIPVKLVSGENKISAYAFNCDNIKSKDADIIIIGGDNLKRQGTAYIVGIGVNNYANSGFDLKCAVADVNDMADTLSQSLTRVGDYRPPVIVQLLNQQATKANIQAAFNRLAGPNFPLPPDTPADLQKLKPAEPEDGVIVYFTGHGTAQKDRYFLIPHNLGYAGDPKKIDETGRKEIMKHSISDRDLEEAFEKIDAGRIMLIVDACQSGQALEAEEKRRGPMNSRGLAQLAYEKGIYILAAAQSHQAALEFDKLGHGLLTYVLIEQGMKRFAADSNKEGQITVEKWFDYAIQHVPQEIEIANKQYLARTGKGVDYEITVTGQVPQAFYRRERAGKAWVLSTRESDEDEME